MEGGDGHEAKFAATLLGESITLITEVGRIV